MMCDLHNALEELESWKQGKGLLLHAEHCTKNYFCSGGHLETGIPTKQISIDLHY